MSVSSVSTRERGALAGEVERALRVIRLHTISVFLLPLELTNVVLTFLIHVS